MTVADSCPELEHPPRTSNAIVISVTGSVLPAIVGLTGTVLATTQAHTQRDVIVALTVWSVVGYLSLSDFGLTRTSARLTSSASPSEGVRVVVSLWRLSTAISLALCLGVVILVSLLQRGLGSSTTPALWLLTLAPLVVLTQFPVIGLLEAQGRWVTIALNRCTSATYTYLLPAVLLMTGSPVSSIVWSVVGGRMLSLIWLTRSAGVFNYLTRSRRRSLRSGPPVRIASLATWIGLSSVLGPAMLYVDRAVLGGMPVSQTEWTFYVLVSEIMLKTYIIPTAVVAVLFPWFVRNMTTRSHTIRRMLLWGVPAALTTTTVVVLVATATLVPGSTYEALGLTAAQADSGRVILLLALGGTAVNWSSQIYIAVLHAADQQRRVVAVQLSTILPFAAGLWGAHSLGSIEAIAVVWLGRIVLTWAGLYAVAALLPQPFGPKETGLRGKHRAHRNRTQSVSPEA